VAAVRSKRDASIVQAAAAVGEGRADALVSAGSTGPTLAAATAVREAHQGRLPPGAGGADADPRRPGAPARRGRERGGAPEHLVQFAYMGAGFMEAVVGSSGPSVGLLSVGEESGKGTPDVLTAHDRIAEAGALNFAGNVEGFDIPTPA
jgi:glycerol-3-phosphate acyltransferase PlsX